METAKIILWQYKTNWIGSIAGALAGYSIVKHKIKNENIYVQIGGALLGSVVGQQIEYKIRSSHGLSKTKKEIVK